MRFLLILISFVLSTQQELRAVYETFRHGARGPIVDTTENPDVFGTKWDGYMELSYVGKRQHYLLGRKLNSRYKGYLNDKYQPDDLYVFATNVNRTIESALSHVQGLYFQSETRGHTVTDDQGKISFPPISKNKISQDILTKVSNLKTSAIPNFSTIVPVHVIRFKSHFFPLSEDCPNNSKIPENNNSKLIEMGKWYWNLYGAELKEVLELNFDYKEDLDAAKYIESLTDVIISNIYEQRATEKLNLLKTKVDFARFKEDTWKYHGQEFVQYLAGDYKYNNIDFFFARLGSSPFYRDLLTYFDKRIDTDNKGDKSYSTSLTRMKMFSAHDSTIGAQISYLWYAFKLEKLKDFEARYASNILYELKLENGAYKVDVYHFSSFTTPVISVDYNTFKTKISEALISFETASEFCEYSTEFSFSDLSYLKLIVLILSIIAIVFLLIVSSIILFFRKKIFPGGTDLNVSTG